MPNSATSMPTAAMPPAHQKASWKPLTSAWFAVCTAAVGWCSRPLECEVAMVARIASPSAPPNSREVLATADARPASCGLTPEVAQITPGTNANGIANRDEQARGQQLTEVVGVNADVAQPGQADRKRRHPEHQQAFGAEAHGDLRGDRRSDDDRERHRQEHEPGLDRRVPEHVLQIQGEEEPHRKRRGTERRQDRVGRRSCRERNSRSGISGALAIRPSSNEEREQQRDADADRQQRRRVAPAGAVGAHDSEHERRETERGRERAAEVEVAGGVLVATLEQHPLCEEGRGQTDRQVDEEDPAPAQGVGDDAAEQHAGRAAGAAHGAPDADRTVAFGGLRECAGEDRQRSRRNDRGGEALHQSRGDQHGPVSARPQAREAREKSTRPNTKTLRRPSRSAARPPRSRNPAKVTV